MRWARLQSLALRKNIDHYLHIFSTNTYNIFVNREFIKKINKWRDEEERCLFFVFLSVYRTSVPTRRRYSLGGGIALEDFWDFFSYMSLCRL
jgi:hypothetical protein